MIGAMRDRATFQRRAETDDGYGGVRGAWTDLLTVWGRFAPERGRQAWEAGREQSTVRGILTVRSGSDTQAVTADDAVTIGGERYEIEAITNPDRRGRFLEIMVRRGVGV